MNDDRNLYDKVHQLDLRLARHEVSQTKDIASIESARRIQAIEYERRLDILNGEAGRLLKMQADYLPREVWNTASNEINKEINQLKSYRDISLGRQAIIATIIPVIISLLFLWLNKQH